MSTPISGLASGFDWSTMVDQLTEVERAPQRQLLAEQTGLYERSQAIGSLVTQLGVLRNRVTALKDPALYESRSVTSSDSARGTAAVSAGATVGRYTFAISQLATHSLLAGSGGVGRRLSETAEVSGLALSAAGFHTAVSSGSFTVNGRSVTVESSDTLGSLFDKIAAATDEAVTAAYDPETDRIRLSSAAPIVLGSATDTSNFLQVARLHGNHAPNLESASELGSIRLSGPLAQANFGVALTGGSAGAFKINGVTMAYDTATDSVAGLLDRINKSAAGVVASYDAVQDRFTLTNKNTGSLGLALEEVAGNFLEAAGWLNGSLSLGRNLEYSINGGGTLVSHSNTITAASSGLAGLSVTALAEETFTVTVGVDTAKIKEAIVGLVSEYNRTQSQIGAQTASSTDARGKVTSGLLADDPATNELSRQLRAMVTGSLAGMTGPLTRLDSLGFRSNGYDDTLATGDLAELDRWLTDHLPAVQDFFSDGSAGLANRLDTYLESAIGDSGSLVSRQTSLNRQAVSVDAQVADLEKLVQANREQLIASFVAMEQVQSRINQQMQFLFQQLGQSNK